MAILIAGHQRSGTTLLQDLCNSHPEIAITGEFGNFMLWNEPLSIYRGYILQRWWKKRNSPILDSHPVKGVNMARNLVFVLRYLSAIEKLKPAKVTPKTIEQATRQMFPQASMVGDKYPDHVFFMSKLSRYPHLKCVFIYRDPRDVASSTLKRSRVELRKTWPDEMRNPREIAERWVLTIEMMERCRERIFSICYEELVTQPAPILQALGKWLRVDPAGFDAQIVRPTSIGKYREGLSAEEIQAVETVAGATMRRIGYEV